MVLLELARGKVPLAGCSFTKIILDTVHGDAPSLQTCGCTHRYSKVGFSALRCRQEGCRELGVQLLRNQVGSMCANLAPTIESLSQPQPLLCQTTAWRVNMLGNCC
jgi:hypothetical protein